MKRQLIDSSQCTGTRKGFRGQPIRSEDFQVHSRQAAGQVYNWKVTQSESTGLVQEDAWLERC